MFAVMHFAQIAGIAVLVVLVLGIPLYAGFISGQAWARRKDERVGE